MTKSQTIAIRGVSVQIIRTAPVRRVTTDSTIGARRTQRGPPAPLDKPGGYLGARFVRRDALVLEYLPLVKAIAIHAHAGLPVHVDLDDLVQAGILGLIDAANKFDATKHVAFSSYAKHRIKGEIFDSLRKLDWASRDIRRRQKEMEAVTHVLSGVLQRTPTEAEVAEKLGVDIDRWHKMRLDLQSLRIESASTRANENDDLPPPDFPSAPDTHPDWICALEQLRGALEEAAMTLPERYQQVVRLYYTNDLKMKEIGMTLGINESRVSQIHKMALQKMANVLRDYGIDSYLGF
jgi:RNA polymerase sigma factor for flagellar operon FliA